MQDQLTVRQVRPIGRDVFELQLDREGVPFVPGDCLALYAADGRVSRPYSLASGIDEDIFRFVIRQMPGGEVSPYLASRRPGDRVRVSPPFGWFRPGEHAGRRPFVFLATGTGIAPFLSHFRSRPAAPRATCLYGVRHAADAVDADWLATVCDLRLAVSREPAPGHHHGRITGLLAGLTVSPHTDYYLCGLDAMIDEATAWLETRGAPLAHIHRECFFNASYDT